MYRRANTEQDFSGFICSFPSPILPALGYVQYLSTTVDLIGANVRAAPDDLSPPLCEPLAEPKLLTPTVEQRGLGPIYLPAAFRVGSLFAIKWF